MVTAIHLTRDQAPGIVEQIRSMDPPERFLQKDMNSKTWVDIGVEKSSEKTSQALRENARDVRTQLDSIHLTRDQAPGIGWPVNEDMALHQVMARQKSPINWETVSKEMNCGRSARECHDRWTRYLKPGTRKGQWREEEDAFVLKVIAVSPEQPFTQWADLAALLPGRSGKQIRDHWVNYLNPSINHLPFSREDDLKLWHGHRELGKRWVEISGKIFNSTRSENHIKNRWYSAAFKKFIAKEYGIDAYVQAKQIQAVVPTHPGKREVMPALGGSSSRGGGRTSKREH